MSLQVWSCQRKGSGSTGAKLWPNVDNMPTAQDPCVWGSKWHRTGTHQAAGRLQTTSCCTGIENIGSFLSPYLSIKDLSGACGRPVERQEGGDWIHPGLWYLGWAEFDIVFVKIDCCCMTSMDYGFWRRHLVVGCVTWLWQSDCSDTFSGPWDWSDKKSVCWTDDQGPAVFTK